MKAETEIVFAEDPAAVVLGELEVTTLGGEDLPRAALLLEEEHYLGNARPVGRTLVQAVHHGGRWVALLMWGPAITERATCHGRKIRLARAIGGLNASLAILRVALLSIKFRQGVSLSWPRIFEQSAHSTVPAFSLINGKAIK